MVTTAMPGNTGGLAVIDIETQCSHKICRNFKISSRLTQSLDRNNVVASE